LPLASRPQTGKFYKLVGIVLVVGFPVLFWTSLVAIGSRALGIDVGVAGLAACGVIVGAVCLAASAVLVGGTKET
jgi:hypothetical protein